MIPTLKISRCVLKRLEQVKTKCSGCLFGLMYQGTLVIIGFNVESPNGTLNYKKIQHNFPTEVDLCGLIKFGLCSDTEAHLNDILQDIDITDNPILLTCDVGTVVGLKASVFKHGQLQEITYEITEDEELFKDFFLARLQCDLQVICDENEKSIRDSMQSLRKRLASGLAAFNVQNTKVYLTGGNSGSILSGINQEGTMYDLLTASQLVVGEGLNVKSKNKKQIQQSDYEIIKIDMFLKKTKEKIDDIAHRRAGHITVFKTKSSTEIPLHVDALSMLHRNTKAILLYDILVESVCRSLRLIEQNLIAQLKYANETTWSVPKTYHFFPQDFGHFFTCIYPLGISDDDTILQQKRKKLHHQFNLPLNCPYFRRANNFIYKEELINKPLINPHIGLKAQIVDGKQFIVKGKYSYHHYMQDNFDDNGWGCAYRSLQTLCSWFRLQGYTNRPIPTHKEIQKYLVDIDDKPKTFLDSKQWIGSTEVSMCLNEFVKVDSKIMFVRSGADLAYKGAELSLHFETQGTPIMIGGGVLAHTILGIDYNNTTGELKFLILDPHYTGSEDLTVIQNKGWCNWKNSDFWDKKSYYNLCMPQRPNIF